MAHVSYEHLVGTVWVFTGGYFAAPHFTIGKRYTVIRINERRRPVIENDDGGFNTPPLWLLNANFELVEDAE